MRVELCFTYRLQNLENTLLNQSVVNCGDSKWSHFTVLLGDFHSPDFMRLVVVQALSHILANLFVCQFGEVINIFGINSRRFATAVFLEGSVCQFNILRQTYQFHQVGECLPILAVCVQFVQYALEVVIFGIPQLSLLFVSACQSQQLLSEPLFLVLLEPLILCSINLLCRLTNAHPSTMFPWLQRYYGITLSWIKSGYSLPLFPANTS